MVLSGRRAGINGKGAAVAAGIALAAKAEPLTRDSRRGTSSDRAERRVSERFFKKNDQQRRRLAPKVSRFGRCGCQVKGRQLGARKLLTHLSHLARREWQQANSVRARCGG